MRKYSIDNLPPEAHIQMLAKEATELEWVNRALKRQISINDNRLMEIEKELEKYVREQKMSSVSRDTTVTLTEEERELLITAIQKCEEIARDCNDEDLFVDASNIFACIYDSYRNGELPTVINIYE